MTARGAAAALRLDWRARLASAVWALHTAITAFFTVAWALPWRWALWTVLIGCALLELQWWLNGGQCVLTELERRLRRHSGAPADEEPGFIAGLLHGAVGRAIPQRWIDLATHTVVCGGAAVAALRLA